MRRGDWHEHFSWIITELAAYLIPLHIGIMFWDDGKFIKCWENIQLTITNFATVSYWLVRISLIMLWCHIDCLMCRVVSDYLIYGHKHVSVVILSFCLWMVSLQRCYALNRFKIVFNYTLYKFIMLHSVFWWVFSSFTVYRSFLHVHFRVLEMGSWVGCNEAVPICEGYHYILVEMFKLSNQRFYGWSVFVKDIIFLSFCILSPEVPLFYVKWCSCFYSAMFLPRFCLWTDFQGV